MLLLTFSRRLFLDFTMTGFLLLVHVVTDVQNSRSSFQFPCRVVYQVETSWRGWFSRNAPFERSWGNLIDEIYIDMVIHIHICIGNWRASCKKGVYRILADFHFFAGSSWFLADWLVLTWKASFRNFFGQLALPSPEITYAKRLSFAWSGILMSESFEGRFRLLLAALTACFL